MRRLTLAAATLALGACAPGQYYYNFDITDPGAVNVARPGERDFIEDADVKSEIVVDPTSWQAILLDITNKTDQTLQVYWSNISIIGPDGSQQSIRAYGPLGQIEPRAKVVVHLLPFSLPAIDPAAQAYNNARYELVVPMNVRGQTREYRYHLVAHLMKM